MHVPYFETRFKFESQCTPSVVQKCFRAECWLADLLQPSVPIRGIGLDGSTSDPGRYLAHGFTTSLLQLNPLSKEDGSHAQQDADLTDKED